MASNPRKLRKFRPTKIKARTVIIIIIIVIIIIIIIIINREARWSSYIIQPGGLSRSNFVVVEKYEAMYPTSVSTSAFPLRNIVAMSNTSSIVTQVKSIVS